MAEVIIAKTVCDTAKHTKEQIVGETVLIRIGAQEFEIDWCPACHGKWTDSLVRELELRGRLVSDGGKTKARKPPAIISAVPTAQAESTKAVAKSTKPKRAKAKQGLEQYPCLWCDHAVSSNVGAMLHAQGKHNTATISMVELFGTKCPLCGHDGGKLGDHTRKDHGTNIQTVFLKAEKSGDPYGIVATVKAKGTPLPEAAEKDA